MTVNHAGSLRQGSPRHGFRRSTLGRRKIVAVHRQGFQSDCPGSRPAADESPTVTVAVRALRKEAVAELRTPGQENQPTPMPQFTPNNPRQAARQYAAALRNGHTLGAVNLSFLRDLASRCSELRQELAVYFGITDRDRSPSVEGALPQLRKKVSVFLVTGTKTQTVLEKVTFIGTRKGFWRIEHASGERATITPGPNVLLDANQKLDLFTQAPPTVTVEA